MPSLDEVLASYARTLVAKVQLSEFAGWGDATTGSFRRQIAAHVELEQEYLREVTARRRSRPDGHA